MSIDYSILKEFNINKEEVETHISKSSQVNKYVLSICDEKTIKSTRTRQVKGLKELLRNLKEWYCSTCNLQSYQKTSYSRHISGVEHRAAANGRKVIYCSSAKCRKPFASEDELEEHLQFSRKCVSISPKNKAREDYKKLMTRINREKELYNLVNYQPDKLTETDIDEYNGNIIKEYSNDTNYTINTTAKIFKAEFSQQEQKPIITKVDQEWIEREMEIEEEDRVLAEKIESNRQAIIDEAKRIEDEKEMRMYERDFYGTDEKSNLGSDRFLTGLSSSEDDEYEEENIKVV